MGARNASQLHVGFERVRMKQLYRVLDLLELRLPRHAQFIMHLELQPEFWRCTEVSRKPQGCVGCDPSPAAHDLIQAGGIHRQRFGELVYAHVQRLELVFRKDL